MGEVVELRKPPAPGNDVREALSDALSDMGEPFDLAHVDLLLAWLWYHGFKIVPVER